MSSHRARTFLAALVVAAVTAIGAFGQVSVASAAPVAVETAPSPTVAADVTLASIAGHVAGSDVAHLEGASVSLHKDGSYFSIADTVTAADGTYLFEGIDAGNYTLCFSHGGYLDAHIPATATICYSGPTFEVAAGALVTGKDITLTVASTISGIVTGEASPNNVGLENAHVSVRTTAGVYLPYSTSTLADGSYVLSGLPAGSYSLQFSPAYSDKQHLGEWWNDKSTQVESDAIVVAEGQDVQDISAVLSLGAVISGHVTGPGGANLQYVQVQASRTNGAYVPNGTAQTDADGNYTISGLQSGTYQVQFGGFNYLDPNGASPYLVEYWNDSPTLANATALTVAAGSPTTGIDAALTLGGSIAGNIKNSSGANLEGAQVQTIVQNGSDRFSIRTVSTDSLGNYVVRGLPTGSYLLYYDDDPYYNPDLINYAPQWWNNKPNVDVATPIAVTLGQALAGKNVVLAVGAKISGTVLAGGTAVPNGVQIGVYDDAGRHVATEYVGTSTYVIDGLAAGTYRFQFVPSNYQSPLAPEWWNDKPTLAGATPITFTTGQSLTNQNVVLSTGATISGTVRGDGTPAAAVPLASVCAYYANSTDSSSAVGRCGQTDSAGHYTIPGLGAASYKLNFSTGTSDSYAEQWWNAKTSFATANVVPVTAGQILTGKDVQLNSGSSISGTVTLDSNPGVGVAGASVCAALKSAFGCADGKGSMRTATTDSDGHYRIGGLNPGEYALFFADAAGDGEYYNDVVSREAANGITVGSLVSITGINASLGPVLPDFASSPAPTITGTPTAGSVLTAVPGTWNPADVSLTYQWLRSGVVIAGATQSTFALDQVDAGYSISVVVTGSKNGYRTAVRTSAPTPIVGGGILTDTPAPTITGVLTVGQALTATPGTWGPAPVGLTYQWKRDGLALAGKNTATYLSVAADAGKTISVSVMGSRPGYRSVVETTVAGAIGAALTPTSVPTITGTPTIGSTLTAVPGAWGPAPVTLAYQWLRDGTAVDGRTSSTYLLGADDAGTSLSVVVTATKPTYTTVVKTSAAVPVGYVITPAPVPTVTGTPTEGQTLTADPGVWGPGSVDLAYQWKLAGVAIPGQSASTYVIGDVAPGVITVTVTGTQAGYLPVSKTSAGLTTGNALTAPVPTITGSALPSNTLTAVPGTWTAGTALAYQWKRDGVAVAGKTAATYALTATDSGTLITVTVTGTKATFTQVSVTSNATAIGGMITGPIPQILGTPTVGSVLTVNPGIWAPAPVTFVYHWTRDGAALADQIDTTYTVLESDVSHIIGVTVTGSKSTGVFGVITTINPGFLVGYPLESTPTPTISGTPTVGQTLTADAGTWAPDGTALAYQWKRGTTAIAGATTSTYKLVVADAAQTITVAVTGSLPTYVPVIQVSSGLVVGNALTAPTPTVSGTPTVGSTLTIAAGTWGPAPVALAYQWFRDDVAIPGKTASTYLLAAADAATTITATVTGTKASYTTVKRTTAPITAGAAITPSPVPTITGSPTVNATLTAVTGTWGPGTVAFSYQWKRGAAVIAGATDSTYSPIPADAGQAISVSVTGSQSGYTSITKSSAAVTVGLGMDGEVSTILSSSPASGVFTVGATLTADIGPWTAGAALTYQWKRDGITVAGKTATTYVLTAADAGSVLSVTVTGTKSGYTMLSLTSAPTVTITGGTLFGPVPSITGIPTLGSTLTAVPGVWGPSTVAVGYQWLRAGVPIADAVDSTYVVADEDRDAQLTVAVTGTRLGYTTLVKTSLPTGLAGYALPDVDVPVIQGTGIIGQQLSVDAPAAWADPIVVAFQWKRGSTVLVGQTTSTYTPVPADAGQSISVTVSGSETGFVPVSKSSSAVPVGNAFTAAPDPTVSGSPLVGSTLTAIPGIWGPTPVTLAYQWLRDGVPVAGRTGTTYLLGAADGHTTISVAVTGTKAGYLPATRIGSMSDANGSRYIGYPLTVTPVPTILGSPVEGQTLTANPGAWGPVRGDSVISLAYQWKRGGTVIPGATDQAYTLVAADGGTTITVTVSGMSKPVSPETSVSKNSAGLAISKLLSSDTPTITAPGYTVSQTLTAVPGVWTAGTTFTYQWKRDGVIVAGKTASTYVLAAADAGSALTVSVTGSKAGYASVTRSSAPTATVQGGVIAPAPTPTISGTPTIGALLTANPGTWGPAPITLSYQWLMDGSPVDGETAATFTPTVTGAASVIVTGDRNGYSSLSKTSAAVVIGAALDLTPVPSVSGTPTVGQTLTADPGSWGPAETALAYQWKRGTTAISGATGPTYTLVVADAGQNVRVAVTGSLAGYTSVTKSSSGLAIGNAFAASPVPAVSGSPIAGSTLTAVAGAWGPAPVALSYQWLRDDVPIAGKTATTYPLVSVDAGTTISVMVTGTKAGYTAVARTSAGLAIADLISPATVPVITGIPTIGETLTAVVGAWGPDPVDLTYQWKRNGVAIADATDPAYVVTIDDQAKSLTVTVSGTKDGYSPVAKTSAAVTAGAALSTGTPVITGSTVIPATLTAAAGSGWTAGTTFAYQWKRDGVAVAGKTASTYVLSAVDASSTITVTVTGSKATYTPAATTSGATAIVTGGVLAAPVPTISGAPTVDSVLTANPGTWGPGTVGLSYQWLRNGVAIDGATSNTYALTVDEIGAAVTVKVTGSRIGFTTVSKTSAAITGGI